MSVAYLDTHVVVWLYSGDLKRLSTPSRKAIENHDLLVSPAVLLELNFLEELGRIKASPTRMQAVLEKQVGLKVCERSFGEVVQAASKQGWIRDPFDRLIVGQAAVGGDRLITRDSAILANYAGAVW